MGCPAVSSKSGKERLLSLVAGRLSTAETAELQKHIAQCSDCSAFTDQQASVWLLLDEWQAPEPSAFFTAKTLASVDSASPLTYWERVAEGFQRWHQRPVLPLAVAAVVLATGYFASMDSMRLDNQKPASYSPVVAHHKPLNVEQLNDALEDLQLLHQLDPPKDEAFTASPSI